MKAKSRFEVAIKKLYIAFHDNTLNPECCKQCAVGNILDNTDSWKHLSDHHGSLKLNYIGRVHQNLGRKFNGYTPKELIQIEVIFLAACGYDLPINHQNKKPKYPKNKDVLFKGLSAVIKYLCKLEGKRNIMDYTALLKQKHYPFSIN
ncbi:Na(+)-translocating NADH-quinone reductase subunit F [Tamlana fucoidanivorans]|uniref:Na(+)-translocating NADH-quinone reductase subunit F n=1 Tax=Allotamlana fucoidanivorans TaxID=2583814 RepID=A0A5C4SKV9_9FLAO|nr:Na(+)-translocating NADH-quinone reductase subunit F [Tamlana fucoidanivorans]TNJ44637.1 Na(+)-translocating NADH-quinone reductase subunit F [Tamlana fucoidanivorans]